MEEEQQKTGEQLESVETLMDNEQNSPSGQLQSDVSMPSEAERGVPVGKFKNVDDLLDAYNSLQAEFTRKCQKLSALEKEKAEQNPQEKLENEFSQFLSRNTQAVAYADEIKSRLENNESYKKEQKPFDKIWSEILYEKLTSPNKAKEPIVQDLILQDVELKNLIIENYVKQLQEQKTPVIMSNSGERVTKLETPKPDSFEQAKKVVLDLLS